MSKKFIVGVAVQYEREEDLTQAEAIARAHIPEGVEDIERMDEPAEERPGDPMGKRGFIGFKWELQR